MNGNETDPLFESTLLHLYEMPAFEYFSCKNTGLSVPQKPLWTPLEHSSDEVQRVAPICGFKYQCISVSMGVPGMAPLWVTRDTCISFPFSLRVLLYSSLFQSNRASSEDACLQL